MEGWVDSSRHWLNEVGWTETGWEPAARLNNADGLSFVAVLPMGSTDYIEVTDYGRGGAYLLSSESVWVIVRL